LSIFAFHFHIRLVTLSWLGSFKPYLELVGGRTRLFSSGRVGFKKPFLFFKMWVWGKQGNPEALNEVALARGEFSAGRGAAPPRTH
jgi:hypothetical protein